jgi:hypothetical protein
MDNNQYVYSALNGDKHIRLLRLLPSIDRACRLQGQLFECPLTLGRQTTHLYEALSYTWGTSQSTESIIFAPLDGMGPRDHRKWCWGNWDTNKPERLENEEMWDMWRGEVLEMLVFLEMTLCSHKCHYSS